MDWEKTLLTAVIVALVAVALVWGYKNVYLERFVVGGSNVLFLSAEETAAFLASDGDAYMKNLSPLDLYARKAATWQEYRTRAAEGARDFATDQRVRVARAARAGDAFLRSLRMCELDAAAIADMPWVIALTEGSGYEDGLPHTRGNIIFLSTHIDETHESLVRTLVHEKVHIYQRMHPEAMSAYLERRGFRRWKQRLGEPRIRANPDVDPWIYIDPATEEPMAAFYSTDKPVSITDVVLRDPSFEHPYERIAYEIADRLNASDK
jgi:hypothetical protein